MKNRKLKRVFIGILSFVMICVIGCLIYVNTGQYTATTEAFSVMSGDDKVVAEDYEDQYIAFYPRGKEVDTGFILYTGAKVEPMAYAPLAKKIAESGNLVVIPYLPKNLAILDANKADDIVSEFTNIKKWAVGGHSLGGVMAADYATSRDFVKGLILYASYPQDDKLKTNEDIKVLSIWGSEDGVADINKVDESKDKLPSDTQFIEIEGGNHAGFGLYGDQDGDKKALISAEEQISKAAEYSSKLLSEMK